MGTNCEPSALSKIGITKDAHQAYKNLKAHFEGKTVTDLGVLLASIVKLSYDDRSTIEHYIEEFEWKLDFMKATLSTGEFSKKGLLQHLVSEDDDAKSEFILMYQCHIYIQ
ncbi:hypothetical protein L211DRAFT_847536 [Terfezia boudieri ATCC MYA-4762]|uniref:Uncharacterized protein n=1 Tax=Terfezia boudieri ATCC MYA-4762 TaxID=1051890 RepID=A0A3N4LX34_9PEZI|nr:hypothetical protein L211DRAFT_847536 [Terfezia boudieri ATCC MYA-4762]